MRKRPLPVALLAAFISALAARPATAQVYFDDHDNLISNPAARTTPAAHDAPLRHHGEPINPASIPAVAAPNSITVTVRPSINPLKAVASALFRREDRLYLGLRDGGMAFCDAADGSHGFAVRFAASTPTASAGTNTVAAAPIIDPVRAVAADGDAVYWVSSDGATVFRYRDRGQEAISYAVGAAAGWVQRIAVLDGTVYLFGNGVTRILDPTTGALRAPTDTDLPSDATGLDGRATLYLAPSDHDDDALLASVSNDGSAPRLWRSTRPKRRRHDAGPREWFALPESAPTSDVAISAQAIGPIRPTLTGLRRPVAADGGGLPGSIAVAADGCALAQSNGLRLIELGSGDAAPLTTDIPYGHNPGMPSTVERCAVGGSGVWWQMRGILFRAAADGSETSAYLPWNSAKGAQIQTLLADSDGVYVALDRGGVRHITLDKPSAADGYAGYVRARLGDGTMLPKYGNESDIAVGIEDWQGVPYKWGGDSKAGTDCSGFVGAMHKLVGVTIPRSTSEMAESKQGTRVLDEIRYGDVLVYPGHCSLYIGNGVTAETVAAAVGKASIWRRTDVQVRRYLPE